MPVVNNRKGFIGHVWVGKRIFLDADTLNKITRDMDATTALQKYGYTYAIKILVYKAVFSGPPEIPTDAMSRGGKKSRELAAKEKKVSKKRSTKKG